MPFATLADTKNQSFDYILVGGGTAGLTLAARLTEDPNINVLVLEAGGEHLDDPVINRPWGGLVQMGDPKYDWLHKTTPQKYADGRRYAWNRGKGLGGSSAMNLTTFYPPSTLDIDYWEKLGNTGWNSKDYKKYLDRVTSYRVASADKDLSSELIKLREDSGYGPIKVSYPLIFLDTDVKLQQTLLRMGIPKAKGPFNGDPTGTCFTLNTLDPETHTRSYATSAYYLPNASRPNFSVLPRAYVTRIVTQDQEGGLTATGVEFTFDEYRDVHLVHARKEVILCAGALKSPQILELSGIGRPSILSAIDIPTKLALEGLGENVQEHNCIGLSFQLKDSVTDETHDLLRDPEQFIKHVDLHREGKGIFNVGAVNFTFVSLETISSRAKDICDLERTVIQEGIASGAYSEGLVQQYEFEFDRISKKGPGCQLVLFPGFFPAPNLPIPGKRYVTLIISTNHPFSRGTIHCTSKDPHVDPAFDPHYFEHDIDLQTLVEQVKFARQIAQTPPFRDALESIQDMNPGPEVQTDDQIREWIKENVITTYHTIGSLSMLPHERGGVVDPRLKVYGTTNIRVADISIIPFHFTGPAQASAYVIGEKAADIIKGVI